MFIGHITIYHYLIWAINTPFINYLRLLKTHNNLDFTQKICVMF